MQIDKETRTLIKEAIKALVAQKVNLTRERREYKLATRGKEPEGKRTAFFESIDHARSSLKHDIRHSLLLYGYVRGMDYERLEPKVREGNEPVASDVCLFGDEHGVPDLNKTDVLDWLCGEKSPYEWKRPQDAEEAA
jgi:hypothetical protein